MNLIQVYSTEGQLEAEMVKAFLEAQGLEVVLSQESVGRTYGFTAGRLGQVKILVPESQQMEAIEIFNAMENGEYEDSNFSDQSSDTQ